MEIQAVPLNLINGGLPTPDFTSFLNVIRYFLQSAEGYGTTTDRPTDPRPGQLYYDTTLGQEVVCTTPRAGAIPAVWTPLSAASGASQSQEFTATGAFTFNVPATVSIVYVTLQAPGGRGQKNASGGGGGGAGELIRRYPYIVIPGAAIAGNVGAGSTTTAAGTTTFGTLTANGAASAGNVNGAAGGGALGGAASAVAGNPGTQNFEILGGGSGGGGNNFAGANCGQYLGGLGAGAANGGGGAASYFAAGAAASAAGTPAKPGPGAGGGGTNTGTSGSGGDGYALIEWIG